MNALFALGTLTLIGGTLGESSLNKRDKTPDALRKNVIASSYLNTLEICPQEVPRCPGKAEPRCFQDSPDVGSPSQNNTQWRCVLCETNGYSAPACFVVIPIETYTSRRRMPRNRKTSEEKNSKKGDESGTRKKTRNENKSQLQATGTLPPKQSFKQYLDGRAGQRSRNNPPQAQPQTSQWRGGINNQPLITQEQRLYRPPILQRNINQPPILQSNINQPPVQQNDINQPSVQQSNINQPPIQQSNFNQPIQRHYTPNDFYPQRHNVPYDHSYSQPPNTYAQATYLPQTQPYVQPQYAGYNAEPQYHALYPY